MSRVSSTRSVCEEFFPDDPALPFAPLKAFQQLRDAARQFKVSWEGGSVCVRACVQFARRDTRRRGQASVEGGEAGAEAFFFV